MLITAGVTSRQPSSKLTLYGKSINHPYIGINGLGWHCPYHSLRLFHDEEIATPRGPDYPVVAQLCRRL